MYVIKIFKKLKQEHETMKQEQNKIEEPSKQIM